MVLVLLRTRSTFGHAIIMAVSFGRGILWVAHLWALVRVIMGSDGAASSIYCGEGSVPECAVPNALQRILELPPLVAPELIVQCFETRCRLLKTLQCRVGQIDTLAAGMSINTLWCQYVWQREALVGQILAHLHHYNARGSGLLTNLTLYQQLFRELELGSWRPEHYPILTRGSCDPEGVHARLAALRVAIESITWGWPGVAAIRDSKVPMALAKLVEALALNAQYTATLEGAIKRHGVCSERLPAHALEYLFSKAEQCYENSIRRGMPAVFSTLDEFVRVTTGHSEFDESFIKMMRVHLTRLYWHVAREGPRVSPLGGNFPLIGLAPLVPREENWLRERFRRLTELHELYHVHYYLQEFQFLLCHYERYRDLETRQRPNSLDDIIQGDWRGTLCLQAMRVMEMIEVLQKARGDHPAATLPPLEGTEQIRVGRATRAAAALMREEEEKISTLEQELSQKAEMFPSELFHDPINWRIRSAKYGDVWEFVDGLCRYLDGEAASLPRGASLPAELVLAVEEYQRGQCNDPGGDAEWLCDHTVDCRSADPPGMRQKGLDVLDRESTGYTSI